MFRRSEGNIRVEHLEKLMTSLVEYLGVNVEYIPKDTYVISKKKKAKKSKS